MKEKLLTEKKLCHPSMIELNRNFNSITRNNRHNFSRLTTNLKHLGVIFSRELRNALKRHGCNSVSVAFPVNSEVLSIWRLLKFWQSGVYLTFLHMYTTCIYRVLNVCYELCYWIGNFLIGVSAWLKCTLKRSRFSY